MWIFSVQKVEHFNIKIIFLWRLKKALDNTRDNPLIYGNENVKKNLPCKENFIKKQV